MVTPRDAELSRTHITRLRDDSSKVLTLRTLDILARLCSSSPIQRLAVSFSTMIAPMAVRKRVNVD